MVKLERVDKDLVLVMGLTGSGKTFFISQLTGENHGIGNKLRSCTERCLIVEASIGNTDFVIMDSPGFDDTTRSDVDILKEITEQLSAIRLLGFNLKGIIYLHRITDNRMAGTAVKNLELFGKLVGEDALPNVVLATTMWGNVTDIAEANSRDSELRDEYWGDMRRKGSTATRFDGSPASAEGIVAQLLGKRTVVLKVQEQLVDQKLSLSKTSAGAFLTPRILSDEVRLRQRMEELEKELKFEQDSNNRLEAKKSQRRNAAALKKRIEDKETMQSKPGEEVESRLSKWTKGGGQVATGCLQALAAICSITFGIVGFALGGGF